MKKATLLLISGLMVSVSGQALAQNAAPAAPTPPTPPKFGAAIPGQCYIDTSAALSDSSLGHSASDRLVQLKAQVDAELSGENDKIQAEYNTLAQSQKASSATPAGKTAWETKAKAWTEKRDAFQQKVQQRSQEMQYTQEAAMQAVFQKMIPHINSVVTEKGCSTVVQADTLLHYETTSNTNGQATQSTFTYVNPAMDITTAVIQKMNASGETLPQFDRVHLDPAPAQGAAPVAKKP